MQAQFSLKSRLATGVTEAVCRRRKSIQAELHFWTRSLLSISGGVLFSPLRKREFVRVQGFERDDKGNLVLTNASQPDHCCRFEGRLADSESFRLFSSMDDCLRRRGQK